MIIIKTHTHIPIDNIFYLSIAAFLLLFQSVAPLSHVAQSLPLSGINGFTSCLPDLLFTSSIPRHNDYFKRICILIVTLIYNTKYSNHSTNCILCIHINRIFNNTKYSYISLTNFCRIISYINSNSDIQHTIFKYLNLLAHLLGDYHKKHFPASSPLHSTTVAIIHNKHIITLTQKTLASSTQG
jgi:hypothetical protein